MKSCITNKYPCNNEPERLPSLREKALFPLKASRLVLASRRGSIFEQTVLMSVFHIRRSLPTVCVMNVNLQGDRPAAICSSFSLPSTLQDKRVFSSGHGECEPDQPRRAGTVDPGRSLHTWMFGLNYRKYFTSLSSVCSTQQMKMFSKLSPNKPGWSFKGLFCCWTSSGPAGQPPTHADLPVGGLFFPQVSTLSKLLLTLSATSINNRKKNEVWWC